MIEEAIEHLVAEVIRDMDLDDVAAASTTVTVVYTTTSGEVVSSWITRSGDHPPQVYKTRLGPVRK